MTDLNDQAKRQLRRLTTLRRNIVIDGLRRKLRHLDRTGHLSYRYDVCPVCQDMGSTEDDPKCGECYIEPACQMPFTEGFRDDQPRGERYFRDMLDYLRHEDRQRPVLVVGGDWNEEGGRGSKIASKIAERVGADLLNGGTLEELASYRDVTRYPMVYWMPNVPNEAEKLYPRKAVGSVLVVSKVMRKGVTQADAAQRIFAMGANAVIEITPKEATVGGKFRFRVADALNNAWADTGDLSVLLPAAGELFAWTRSSERVRSVQQQDDLWGRPAGNVPRFIELVRQVADRVETEMGGRYFGNLSTRCMKMFPSARIPIGAPDMVAWVSPRNIDKHRIEPDDLVLVAQTAPGAEVLYWGDRKPSVDAAIQLELYRRFLDINYMIHGHAFVEGAPFTDNYYPCGDLREVAETAALILERTPGVGAINLKQHGFLLFANDLVELEAIVQNAKFRNRL